MCTVKNTGSREGDEVVMAFHSAGSAIRNSAPHPVPLKSLVDFDRVSLVPGEVTTLTFTFTSDTFALVDETGCVLVQLISCCVFNWDVVLSPSFGYKGRLEMRLRMLAIGPPPHPYVCQALHAVRNVRTVAILWSLHGSSNSNATYTDVCTCFRHI